MSSQDQLSEPEPEPSVLQSSTSEPSARAVIYSMKRHPEGNCHFKLGSDGVMRCFGPRPEYPILDAVGFSPSQIKSILDLSPWSREMEDRFRGVDGRKVADYEALFNPPESERPPVYTDEEIEMRRKEIEEINRKTLEKIEGERAEGVDVAAKYACGRAQSDHDLRPKEGA